jgi:hypothetical protein
MVNIKFEECSTEALCSGRCTVYRNVGGGPLKIEADVFSKYYVIARYDVLTVVLLKIQVFRVVAPCRLVSNILGLLGPNDEDTTIFRNVQKYIMKDIT